MTDNLTSIISYINCYWWNENEVSAEKVENLLKKYSVSSEEKKKVYDILKTLHIDIIPSKDIYREKIHALFQHIGSNKELLESDLLEWFEQENIDDDMKKKVRDWLRDARYKIIDDIIKDKKKDKTVDAYAFLDDLEFDNLDDILDSQTFQDEIDSLKDVIDKRYNLDYLTTLHSTSGTVEKKSEALDNLVNANKRLVWKIAKHYEKFSTASFDIEDMLQAGMQGLIKAAERFDESKGFQFSTYATWWIKQSISRGIADCSTTIRLPVHMRDRVSKLMKVKNEFWYNNGRAATRVELAELLGVSEQDICDLLKYKEIANLTSLDITIGEDEDSCLGDFIPDELHQSLEDYVIQENLKDELEKILNEALKPIELEVIKLRFGLIDGQTHTLEEIGQSKNVTRERIRQIEAKALGHLKCYRKRLRDFTYD